MKPGDKIPQQYFLPYQVDWIEDGSDAQFSEKSRRTGFSYADSYKSVRDRHLIDHRRDLWFSSADESAAFEYALYCRQWCEIMEVAMKEICETLEDEKGYKYNNYVIVMPNGSRINCMSSNPRRFRSKGGDVVLDEFAWHDQPGEMLDAAYPVTTWGFKIRILSTHNGESSVFNRLILQINKVLRGEATFDQLKMLHFRLHRVTILDAVEQGLAEKVYKLDTVTPEAREKFIRSCRARCRNEDAWNQEYMCIPSSSESTLISYDLYQSCEDPQCLLVIPTGPKYVGVDIGRERDLTVFWVAELVGDVLVTRQIIKLHRTPYEEQYQTGCRLLRDPAVVRLCGDATGLGDPLVERWQKDFGEVRVEKVKFSAPVKDHLASLLLGRFTDRKIRVPADVETREAFHKIKKTISASGQPRYDAARTDEGHADEFWAAALCGEAANTPAVKPGIINLTAEEEADEYFD
jgi:phage FluMu gp28-like protein